MYLNILKYLCIIVVLTVIINLGVHFPHYKIIWNSEGTCAHKSGKELRPKTQFASTNSFPQDKTRLVAEILVHDVSCASGCVLLGMEPNTTKYHKHPEANHIRYNMIQNDITALQLCSFVVLSWFSSPTGSCKLSSIDLPRFARKGMCFS